MTVAFENDQIEKQKAEQIIADTPLFEGVKGISVELADDHTGDPAMWLVFYLQPELEADEKWLQQFNEYSHQLDMKIIQSGISRFPYTRLRSAA